MTPYDGSQRTKLSNQLGQELPVAELPLALTLQESAKRTIRGGSPTATSRMRGSEAKRSALSTRLCDTRYLRPPYGSSTEVANEATKAASETAGCSAPLAEVACAGPQLRLSIHILQVLSGVRHAAPCSQRRQEHHWQQAKLCEPPQGTGRASTVSCCEVSCATLALWATTDGVAGPCAFINQGGLKRLGCSAKAMHGLSAAKNAPLGC